MCRNRSSSVPKLGASGTCSRQVLFPDGWTNLISTGRKDGPHPASQLRPRALVRNLLKCMGPQVAESTDFFISGVSVGRAPRPLL